MAIYDFHIEIAQIPYDEVDEAGLDEIAWTLMEEFTKAVEATDVQLNFATLTKNGKDYPNSKEEMEKQKRFELIRKKYEAEQHIKDIQEALFEAKNALARLNNNHLT